MPKKERYRLQPILDLKAKAKRASELALAKAIRQLEDEKKKLKKLEAEKKAVHDHRLEIRQKHSEKVIMGESSIRDNELYFNFMRKLEEDEAAIEERILDQKNQIAFAEERLRRSRRDYIQACNELKMMEKHKELWAKKRQAILSAKEEKELGELGNVVFQLNQSR